jgi:hypothetical protein
MNNCYMLLVFHAYINEMHVSRSKIPSKKSSHSVARTDLIPVFNSVCAIICVAKPEGNKRFGNHMCEMEGNI